MSVQALGWAFQQEIRNRAKTVLLALANHADHTSGYCYPGIELIMKEASVSRASAYSFISALKRNDYITVKITKERNGRRCYHFWLHFDRMDRPWINAKDEENDFSDDTETQDIEESPKSGLHEIPPRVQNLETPVQDLDSGVQNLDSAYIMLEPSDKPLIPEQVDSPASTASAPPPLPPQPQADKPKAAERTRPHGFDPDKRRRELERLKAAEEARRPQLQPVIEGSEPWFAWLKYKNPQTGRCHPPTLTTTIDVKGRSDRGWYFPTLWPPKETGPPGQAPPLSLPKTG